MTTEEAVLWLDKLVVATEEYEAEKERVVGRGVDIARAMRKESGLSVRKFAAALDVSYAYLAKIEAGRLPLTYEVAKKMMDYDAKD